MKSKTILISGGTNGIGKGAAQQLLKDGHNVVAFSRTREKCDALTAELTQKYPAERFLVQPAGVNNKKSLLAIVDSTLKKFKSIDVLINNAGFGYFAASDEVDIKRYEDMIQTNVVGMARLTKLVVPQMKKQKSGLILNISSISGTRSSAQGEFYSATKFAVMGYSDGLRKELEEFGIKVSTLCPGMIRTDFFSKEEFARRKKGKWHGVVPPMMEVEDINRIISLICNQSAGCDIQDLTVMPFGTDK